MRAHILLCKSAGQINLLAITGMTEAATASPHQEIYRQCERMPADPDFTARSQQEAQSHDIAGHRLAEKAERIERYASVIEVQVPIQIWTGISIRPSASRRGRSSFAMLACFENDFDW